ncbi:MAG: hypothetical protein OEV42_14830 [Deltaproteobacteria bacterium]|nr:hypothetical protein [Deltaproteobacteria bacterium]
MKKVLFLLILLQLPFSVLGADFTIPHENEIFTIAVRPHGAKIFSSKTLLKDLRKYRIGSYEETGLRLAEDRLWQSGVIVLKDKSVIFWATDRKRFLRLHAKDKQEIYLIRDDISK